MRGNTYRPSEVVEEGGVEDLPIDLEFARELGEGRRKRERW